MKLWLTFFGGLLGGLFGGVLWAAHVFPVCTVPASATLLQPRLYDFRQEPARKAVINDEYFISSGTYYVLETLPAEISVKTPTGVPAVAEERTALRQRTVTKHLDRPLQISENPGLFLLGVSFIVLVFPGGLVFRHTLRRPRTWLRALSLGLALGLIVTFWPVTNLWVDNASGSELEFRVESKSYALPFRSRTRVPVHSGLHRLTILSQPDGRLLREQYVFVPNGIHFLYPRTHVYNVLGANAYWVEAARYGPSGR